MTNRFPPSGRLAHLLIYFWSSIVRQWQNSKTNEPKPLLSSQNKERWLAAGSFVFLPGHSPGFATLAPPQHTPEQQAPESMSNAATFALAYYIYIMSQMSKSLHLQGLAQSSEHAVHTQQVEAARSAKIAEWQRQEDAAHVQALAAEAYMLCCHNTAYRAITNGFGIEFNILLAEVVSWYGADNALVLLATKQCRYGASQCGARSNADNLI
jgi:hypothetical protein